MSGSPAVPGAGEGATSTELASSIEAAERRLQDAAALGLALDMTRGKPASDQLDLAREIFGSVSADDARSADGTDVRNYGVPFGLPEARALLGTFLDAPADRVLIGGNSSLQLMHDVVVQALLEGPPGSERPWGQETEIRFLCPSPGYDRHFFICERYGIEMVTVPMTDEGPDLDAIAEHTNDPTVRGMFCVPRHSNPTGVTFSSRVVEGLAQMDFVAPDFRVIWDNAYSVHHLSDDVEPLEDFYAACQRAGNEDRALLFASTSKVTLAGAGISAVAASPRNVDWLAAAFQIQTIGHDKINQLRHVRFLRDKDGVAEHMRRHAAILRPKFELVDEILEGALADLGLATWTRPKGGYFISLDTLPGCAKEVVSRAASIGVKLTPAGATFPYGLDPLDRNIRIAPTLPPLDELRKATEILADCIVAVCGRALQAASAQESSSK